ncbi:MAG: hypothetical protein ABIE46_01645, partial [Patescibacteria group bacterium]
GAVHSFVSSAIKKHLCETQVEVQALPCTSNSAVEDAIFRFERRRLDGQSEVKGSTHFIQPKNAQPKTQMGTYSPTRMQTEDVQLSKISHELAVTLAESEYEKYRVVQDKNYISDFDREVKKLLKFSKKKL